MDLGRARLEGLDLIEDVGQRLILDFDEFQGLEGRGLVDGRDRRHFLPHEPDLPAGQGRLVVVLVPPLDLRNVVPGQDRLHARQLPGAGDLEPGDAGVGVRTAEQLADKHPRKDEIRRVIGRALHLLRGVDHGVGLAEKRKAVLTHLRISSGVGVLESGTPGPSLSSREKSTAAAGGIRLSRVAIQRNSTGRI